MGGDSGGAASLHVHYMKPEPLGNGSMESSNRGMLRTI